MTRFISITTATLGAVMLVQWALDPENAALPFRLLGLALLSLGVLCLYVTEKKEA